MPGVGNPSYSLPIRSTSGLGIAGDGLLGAGSAVETQVRPCKCSAFAAEPDCPNPESWTLVPWERQNAQNWGCKHGEYLASACKYRAI